MSWATAWIAKLRDGETVQFRPRGNSMLPRIRSGDLVTVAPVVDLNTLATGAVVMCRVGGHDYLHMITAIQGDRVQISNNHGHVNGWTNQKNVFGLLIKVED